MKINGLQKLTLLDFPGRVACTVFTAGCNLRCPFCHNARLVKGGAPEALTVEDFYKFLEKRRGTLDGVAITGGEPTLMPGIESFAEKIKEMGFSVKLDTNGTSPEKLRVMTEAGIVDYVAMDVKNRREKYSLTCGVEVTAELMARIERSVELLLAGRTEYEFRTTVMKELHTPDDIAAAAEWISGAERYYIQQFRDSGELLSGGFTAPSRDEMEAMAAAARPHVKSVALRGV